MIDKIFITTLIRYSHHYEHYLNDLGDRSLNP